LEQKQVPTKENGGHLTTSKTGFRHSKPRRKILQMLGLLSILLLAITPNLRADPLDSTVIGMFPKDAGDFGFADLSQGRQLPWYPQLEAQLVPVALFGFEQFLEAVQMRHTSSINQVAWASVSAERAKSEHTSSDRSAPGSGQPVAVAIGDFDIDTIKSFLDSKNIPSVQMGNYTLYASGTGAGSRNVFFALLDSRTIAFGPLEPLKRVLEIRDGEEDSLLQNEPMMTLIERANGDGIFWGVLNSMGAARAIERLVPETAKFPQSRDLMAKLKELLITVKVPGDIELDFQAQSASSSDAILISQLLQAGVLMRRYQTNSEDNPEMGKLLDTLHIGANGNPLDISLELTNDQLTSLVEHNTFSMKM
jgi:hypothetical protein